MTLTNKANINCLRTAEEIGRHIARGAVWHGDRCNWVGAQPLERLSANFQPGAIYQALGPDLYSGTSGVALFLAELYAVTKEPLIRRVAQGAIRHALSRVEAVSSTARLGLFSGWTGIALGAARAGFLLDEPELLKQAGEILERCSKEERDKREFDLISGRAGAIAALLVLNHMLDDFSLVEFAARLGDELVEIADETAPGHSWQSPNWRNQRNLTGFSHGTAGAAYALLELFYETGDSKYRDAALSALQYERHWFNQEAGNWPDFRKDPALTYRRGQPSTFATFWCHGAPGIALSRLRAYEILEEETCKSEAAAALNTTRASIKAALDTRSGNFSLCHGLAGNAEVLHQAREILGRGWREDAELALAVADYGIDRYAKPAVAWPCGTHVGETPGMMLGLAGIGHFYLRLGQPSVPSILLLRKCDWIRKEQEQEECALSAELVPA